tara:strand:+ start:600 stop:1013 length:414 start_codon:yes stop_codon:yes gene_type:complete
MPEHGDTLGWSGDGGKTSAIMNLTMKVAKLETFARNLEKEVKDVDDLRERITKLESRLEESERKAGELEDLRAVARYANPKMISVVAALFLGGSVAGNTALDSVMNGDGPDQTLHSDEQLQQILNMIQKKQASEGEE